MSVLAADTQVRLIKRAATDFLTLERLIETIYRAIVHVGDICVGGGAAAGLHTIPLASLVGPTGRVIAVEPIQAHVVVLRQRLVAAHLENVEIVEAALSYERGEVPFYIVKNALTRSGIVHGLPFRGRA